MTGSVSPGCIFLVTCRKTVFGDIEDHRDGLQLRDDRQAVRVRRMHHVALIDQPQSDAAGQRRRDVRVNQLEASRCRWPPDPS